MHVTHYILSAAVSAVVAFGIVFVVIEQMKSGLSPAWPEVEARVTQPVEVARQARGEADPGEVARLRQEQAAMAAELEEARRRLADREGALARAQEQLDDLQRPLVADVFSSTLRAELKSGEIVVTGGYRLADGRRLYAFAKPMIVEAGGSPMVMVEGSYLALSDEAGKAVGLDALATNAANTLQHGEVWMAGEETAVMAELADVPGVEWLSDPGVVVRSGDSGTITFGDIQLKVTPTLREGGGGLGMDVRLEQPQAGADEAL